MLTFTAPALAQNVCLQGNIAADAIDRRSVGAAEPSSILNLSVQFLPRDEAGLDALLAKQQDPASPQYHRWLTLEWYTERFVATAKAFNEVSDWLTNNGFVITGGSRQMGQIRLKGNVAKAAATFDVHIMKFGNGSQFANTRAPKVPARYGNVIGEIVGLNNLARIEPEMRPNRAPIAAITNAKPRARKLRGISGLSPAINLGPLGGLDTTFAPPDLYTFYDETPLLHDGIDGTVADDCIAIFSRRNIYPDVLTQFTNPTQLGYSLPPVNLTIDLVNGSDPGVNSAEGEAYLDIEWSHAVAPGAQTVLDVPDDPDYN